MIYKEVLADQQGDVCQRSAHRLCKPKVGRQAHLPLWLEQGFSPEQFASVLEAGTVRLKGRADK